MLVKREENPNLGARAFAGFLCVQTKAKKTLKPGAKAQAGHHCGGCSLHAPRVFTLGLSKKASRTVPHILQGLGSIVTVPNMQTAKQSRLTTNYKSNKK